MLTESRELTLMGAVPTIAAGQKKKWNLREPVSRHSDSRNSEVTTNDGRFTARNTAAFMQSSYSVKAVE